MTAISRELTAPELTFKDYIAPAVTTVVAAVAIAFFASSTPLAAIVGLATLCGHITIVSKNKQLAELSKKAENLGSRNLALNTTIGDLTSEVDTLRKDIGEKNGQLERLSTLETAKISNEQCLSDLTMQNAVLQESIEFCIRQCSKVLPDQEEPSIESAFFDLVKKVQQLQEEQLLANTPTAGELPLQDYVNTAAQLIKRFEALNIQYQYQLQQPLSELSKRSLSPPLTDEDWSVVQAVHTAHPQHILFLQKNYSSMGQTMGRGGGGSSNPHALDSLLTLPPLPHTATETLNLAEYLEMTATVREQFTALNNSHQHRLSAFDIHALEKQRANRELTLTDEEFALVRTVHETHREWIDELQDSHGWASEPNGKKTYRGTAMSSDPEDSDDEYAGIDPVVTQQLPPLDDVTAKSPLDQWKQLTEKYRREFTRLDKKFKRFLSCSEPSEILESYNNNELKISPEQLHIIMAVHQNLSELISLNRKWYDHAPHLSGDPTKGSGRVAMGKGSPSIEENPDDDD